MGQTTHQFTTAENKQVPASDLRSHDIQDLQEAQKRIRELEKKIKDLEKRIPQRYPDVKYLNYRSRKRILVSIILFIHFMVTYYNVKKDIIITPE